jgi:hypothetical protein
VKKFNEALCARIPYDPRIFFALKALLEINKFRASRLQKTAHCQGVPMLVRYYTFSGYDFPSPPQEISGTKSKTGLKSARRVLVN